MVRYISKRIAQSILVLFLVSIVIYGLMYMMPGDPVYAVYGTNLKPGQYEEKYIEMGLDKPVYERYAKWLGGVFQGNLGSSTKYHMPVATLIKARLPVTLYIGGWSILLGTIIGVVLGIICAMHARKMTDNILTVLANIGCAVPDFWIAVILVAIFSTTLGLLPSFGFSFPWENGLADKSQHRRGSGDGICQSNKGEGMQRIQSDGPSYFPKCAHSYRNAYRTDVPGYHSRSCYDRAHICNSGHGRSDGNRCIKSGYGSCSGLYIDPCSKHLSCESYRRYCLLYR